MHVNHCRLKVAMPHGLSNQGRVLGFRHRHSPEGVSGAIEFHLIRDIECAGYGAELALQCSEFDVAGTCPRRREEPALPLVALHSGPQDSEDALTERCSTASVFRLA